MTCVSPRRLRGDQPGRRDRGDGVVERVELGGGGHVLASAVASRSRVTDELLLLARDHDARWPGRLRASSTLRVVSASGSGAPSSSQRLEAAVVAAVALEAARRRRAP